MNYRGSIRQSNSCLSLNRSLHVSRKLKIRMEIDELISSKKPQKKLKDEILLKKNTLVAIKCSN